MSPTYDVYCSDFNSPFAFWYGAAPILKWTVPLKRKHIQKVTVNPKI